MPELPEVEIIKLGLQKYIVGQEIADIEVLSPKQFVGDPKGVIGAKITRVRRFGKGIVIDLSNGFSIVIHLKMTGQLVFGRWSLALGNSSYLSRWTRVVFKIKDPASVPLSGTIAGKQKSKSSDSFLYFNDIRRFGWMRVVETKKVVDLPFFRDLGHEPSFGRLGRPAEGQASLTAEKFWNILASSKSPIKSVLMNQHKISGVGNIYANEALFLARINPLRLASSLTQAEGKRLLLAMEEVLRKGIEAGGASRMNYVNVLGEKGTYQEQFLVYGREGEQCPVCKSIIKKIKTGGRGTFYCPVCQC